jgi:DNA-binding transcriptional ArsR family regulator
MAAEKKKRDRKASAKKKGDELVDQNFIYGLSHPLRVRCLVLLCDETMSPRAISDELGEGISQVAYHVKILVKTGLAESVGTRPVRGAVEHFYRAVHPLVIPEGLWTQLPKPARRKIWGDVLEEIGEVVMAAVKAETFDSRENFHISLTPMRMDEKGCKDGAARTDQYLDDMLAIQGEASKRLGENPEEKSIPMFAVVLMFESACGAEGKKASTRKRG